MYITGHMLHFIIPPRCPRSIQDLPLDILPQNNLEPVPLQATYQLALSCKPQSAAAKPPAKEIGTKQRKQQQQRQPLNHWQPKIRCITAVQRGHCSLLSCTKQCKWKWDWKGYVKVMQLIMTPQGHCLEVRRQAVQDPDPKWIVVTIL